MRGSIQIAKLFGIPVLLHWSFGLLFFYVLYVAQQAGLDVAGIVWMSLFVLALFTCVVLHEFGHALMARRFGVYTKDIILLPIGGIARLNKLPEKPFHEFLVAIAGPLVNIAIALFLSPWFFLNSYRTPPPSELEMVQDYSYFIPALIFLNVILAIFNLLPAFPMDGGRIFRALLSTKMERSKATRIAAGVGQFFAILLLLYGLWQGSIITAFIGVFIFFTASQENQWVQKEGILNQHTVAEIFRLQFTRLQANESLYKALDLLLRDIEKNFLVFDNDGNLIGVLLEKQLLNAGKKEVSVSTVMQPHFETVSPSDSLKIVFDKMHGGGQKILPVLEQDELIGVVDINALNNFLRLQR
jgi:Zn-dependent protease/CBS domain-containing protein